jgi:prepilin-type N-terminal cleavage/methylation domain-containing protein/prepilin-type processing-associated H-X9-DG protein
MKHKKAFTLIELLVVISIIALLMAVLMPALTKARQQAQKITCKANLKDVSVMFRLYAQDNDNKLPSHSVFPYRWYYLITPYYSNSGNTYEQQQKQQQLKCPVEWKKNGEIGAFYSYSTFFHRPTTKDGTPTFPQFWWSKYEQIIQPASLPLMWDMESVIKRDGTSPEGLKADLELPGTQTYGYPHQNMYKHGWDNGNIRSPKFWNGGPAAMHGDAINYMYADGHVGDDGLWPYNDTLKNPLPADDYWKLFHPKRNLNVNPR